MDEQVMGDRGAFAAPDDEGLAQRVREALLGDHQLSSQSVVVNAREGRVELSGVVQSYRRRLAAAELVRKVEGCMEVVDHLRVASAAAPDEEVGNLVRDAIERLPEVRAETIIVKVAAGGKVTLAGSVATERERVLTEDAALGCRGVRAVENTIIVDAESAERDEAQADEVRRMLRSTPALRECDLRVAVSGKAITLSGTVSEAWQAAAAISTVDGFRAWVVESAIVVQTEERRDV